MCFFLYYNLLCCDCERITLLCVVQRRYAIGQAVCVQYTLCYSVGQINLIPSTVYVYLVPSMVASAGIALCQRARDALAAAHSCKQRRQVIADAFTAVQRSTCVRDIFAYLAGCDFICKLCIVGVMPCNVVVDCGYLFASVAAPLQISAAFWLTASPAANCTSAVEIR